MRLHKNNSVCTYETRQAVRQIQGEREREIGGNYQCDYEAYAPVTYIHI